MKISIVIFISLILLILTACGKLPTNVTANIMGKFEQFKQKEKFVEDTAINYPGIADPTLRPILTKKINLAADDFREIAESGTATDKKYQNKIKIGLQRFQEIYTEIDTEDRERICYYFEELMDIVGLKSSDCQLNNFMYGFDPMKKKQKMQNAQ